MRTSHATIFRESPRPLRKGLEFERKLYLARRIISFRLRYDSSQLESDFHASSFSSRTLVYKGMLTTEQLSDYFPDLADPDMESALAQRIQDFPQTHFLVGLVHNLFAIFVTMAK